MTEGDRATTGRRQPAVRTFLIADIRGYTRFTAQHGDEAASRLARRFAEIAGEGVGAWGGELVELRGDEALAVFDSPRRALRCAVELQSAFGDETRADPSLPLPVGIGLDAGEAVPVDEGYRGAALNLAARLCSAAAAGETLASANVVGLAGPVEGLAIGELTGRALKGLEHPVEAALVTGAATSDDRADGEATSPPEEGLAATTFPAELEPVVPLVGRVDELRWLRWHWRRARQGHGRVVVVSGSPGIGKTRISAELATIAQADGAHVRYLPAGGGADADVLAHRIPGPGLLVIDDLDAAPSPSQQAVGEMARGVSATPSLLIVIHREAAAPSVLALAERLAPAERRLTLGPLSADDVRAITALYAGAAADQAPIRQLMDDSHGVPAAAHRAAAVWARSAASEQLGSAAARTEAGRRDLRSAQAELIGDVTALERISERTRRYAPAGVGSAAPDGMTICPYKGLASFEARDAEYYFGRDRLIAELVAKLVGNPFLGFVGASGSGKSSALRAGLLPALAGGVLPGSQQWLQVLMRPGEHPMASLGQALARALPDAPSEGLDPTDPLGDAVARLAPDQGMLLAVDQFEEVFGATRDEAERGAFIDVLTMDRRGLRVVVTVRADHYGHCAAYPQLARPISATHVLVGPLTPPELASVIEAPAERVGLRVEQELVQVLIADAGSEPAVLPLLSTALLELWQARRAGWLTLDAYRAGGGMHGAIARLAEAAYAQLDPGQAAIARSMFLRLAGPGEGEGVVRRRVALSELDADGDPTAGRVLQALTDARLLTTGDGFVEVAHEALLREWPRLQTWLAADAEGRKVRLHLIGAARDWAQRGREPADLYRGARLSAALDWAAEHQVELNANEREFLEASRDATEREVEKERRTNRRLRGLLAGAAVLLVVALGAGGFALSQADAARQQADLAEQREGEAEIARADAETAARFARSRELAASSVSVSDEDPELSKLLAVAAADLEGTGLDIESALHRAWATDRTADRYEPPADEQVDDAQLHPDGGRIVVTGTTGGPARRLAVVDLAEDREIWSFEPEWPDAAVGFARFTPDGRHVVAGVFWEPEGEDPDDPPQDALGVLVLDAETGALVKRIDTGPCGSHVEAVAAGVALGWTLRDEPDLMPSCFAGDHPGRLEAVNLATGERSDLTSDYAGDLGLSSDGHYAAFTDLEDGERSVVVDLATGERVLRLDGSRLDQLNDTVRALNADGTLMLHGDRPMKVIDVATGASIASLGAGEGEHFGVAFGPRSTVYASGRDATLTAWDGTDGRLLYAVPAAGGGQVSVADDGRVLVRDYASGRATLLDQRRALGELDAVATCDGFVPAGQLELAAGLAAFSVMCRGEPAQTVVVDTDRMVVVATLRDAQGQDIALSPDGTRFASVTSVDGIMGPFRIYDAQSGRALVELEGTCPWDVDRIGPRSEVGIGCQDFPERPFALWPGNVEFSPDGRFLAVGDLGLAVWDAATGKLLTTQTIPGLEEDSEGNPSALIFTPDSSSLLVSTFEGNIVEYSTNSWDVIRSVPIDSSVAQSGMSFAGYLPGGSTLVGISGEGGSGGGSLHRIDSSTLEIENSNRAHDGSPKAAALSADGKLLVTGASDGIVRVWEAATGKLLHQFRIPGQAQGVAFLDDTRIAVTPEAGGLLVYTIDPEQLLELVRGSILRGFTPDECGRYSFVDDCPTLEELRGSAP